MTLAPGTKLGPYEIVAPLGAGGMGEVWRARDPRLSRDVAIKALPPAFAQDPERLARFEREARLLASLSHPNIAGIFGLEDVAGTRYLVLEFVDGESLEARLARGALPLDEALDVARQVAAGVEAAHENGVVHRDLKPGNVMRTAAGGVKVLDFGLAKGGVAGAASSSDPSLTASPTMTVGGTGVGVILGTAAYMSPEQARGKPVDRRTDIWSFGCVVYEMLAGRRVYDGETVSDMVARILEREPDWKALPAGTPPRLRRLLERCLTKDARQRLRDIGEARLELEAIAAGDHGHAPATAAPARRGAPAWALAAGALALVAAGAALAWLAPHGTSDRAYTLTLLAPPGIGMGASATDIALSPDGRQALFVGADTLAGPRLWLRALDREGARPFEGTENPAFPFFSPDGRHAGFFADGKLKTLDLATGAVHVLADAPLPRGGSWGDGVILYQPASLGPLWRIPVEGGTPEVATTPDSANGDVGDRFPQFLPDGRHFVLVELGRTENWAAFGTLGEKRVRRLFQMSGQSGPTFTRPNWILGARDGSIKAQRMDPGSGRLSGPALDVPGLRAVSPNTNGAPELSAAGAGLIVQRAAYGLPQRLQVVDRQGHAVGEIAGPEGMFLVGSFAPDGRHALLEYDPPSGDSQVWTADLARGAMQPLTSGGYNFSPAVSPDGLTVALTHSVGDQRQDLYAFPIDAPGSMRFVAHLPGLFNTALGWTPDGRGVLVRSQGTQTRQDIYLVDTSRSDSGKVTPLLASPFNEPVASVSPDGKWLAYVSDESGRYECRVRAFPSGSGTAQVVSRGAYADVSAASRIGLPVWRRDGRELLYVAADGHTLMTVRVTPGDPPVFGEPRPLFRLSNATQDIVVSRDLDRFVLSITREEEGRSAATILVNWPRMLDKSR